ncbi:uncharacterized protein PAC_01588 [Phialocephala subalpina]|uniref:Uncharacterized protein n=1 Tax=Phialocephala subalpina TaxID=576137 RepID=A0A1L7WG16_9HELO|nr:uncharacterized protein PAC_01588 [Phialocephala subalpina]
MSNTHFKEPGIFLCCNCDQVNHIDFNINFPSQCSCQHDLCDGCGKTQAIYEPVKKEYDDDHVQDYYEKGKELRHIKFRIKDGEVENENDYEDTDELRSSTGVSRKTKSMTKLKTLMKKAKGLGKSLSPSRLRMETRRITERRESQ